MQGQRNVQEVAVEKDHRAGARDRYRQGQKKEQEVGVCKVKEMCKM